MFLVRNVEWIVRIDDARTVLRDGAVVIADGLIRDLGKDEDINRKYQGRIPLENILDGSGTVMLPGFVNTHAHVFEHLSRGLFPDDLSSLSWAYEYFFPFQAGLTEDEVYLSAQLACLDMVRSGTTCFFDSSILLSNAHLEAVAQAVRDMGIRAVLGRGVCDILPTELARGERPSWTSRIFASSAGDALSDVERLLKSSTSQWTGRVRAWATIFGLFTFCSDELFVGAKRLADRYGVGTGYHVASFIEEAKRVEERSGHWPITHLDQLGALGPNVVLIHAVTVKDQEVEILARHGTKIAHCPGAAFRLAKGASRMSKVPEMLRTGLAVSLGADGVCACGTFDLTRQMFLVAGLFKDARMDPTLVPAETALEMATLNGAKALLLDKEIGSVEVGKRADLIMLDVTTPEWVPMHDVVRTLVYSGSGASVKHAIVDGEFVVRDRRFVRGDETRILERAREASAAIVARSGLAARSRWRVV
jgi:cytosine/adenosine deaminase-related metal-dependent hydrolase